MGEQDSKDKVLIVEKRLIMNSVGEIIATNRKRLGWSQTELAERLQGEGFNLTNKAISKWEKNDTEPSVTIFLTLCRIMGVTDIYEAYFGSNPDSLVNGLNTAGREKVLDYIELLHDSGKYKSHVCEILPFTRSIDVYETPVSAGTGNMFLDGSKATVNINSSVIPNEASYGVIVSGDSMEPEFHSGEIAWVSQQDTLCDGEIGIFGLNNEAYIKKLKRYADRLYLVSLNSKYSPIEIKESDRLDVFRKVVGKINSNDVPDYRF